MLDWKECFLCLSVCLHLALFTPSFSFFASAQQREHKKAVCPNPSDPDDTFSQLLIRSAIVGLPTSDSYRGFVRQILPSNQTYGWALGRTKEYKEPLESTPVGKCFYFLD